VCRRLAEAGCSANEIAAISGHKTLREVQRYTDAVDQERMARVAIRRLEEGTRNDRATNFSGNDTNKPDLRNDFKGPKNAVVGLVGLKPTTNRLWGRSRSDQRPPSGECSPARSRSGKRASPAPRAKNCTGVAQMGPAPASIGVERVGRCRTAGYLRGARARLLLGDPLFVAIAEPASMPLTRPRNNEACQLRRGIGHPT